jgi:acyl carrier protein
VTSDLSRLQDILRDQLDLPALSVTEQTRSDNIDGWDSLATIRIVVAVEEAFGVTFDASEIENIKSVGDLLRGVQNA